MPEINDKLLLHKASDLIALARSHYDLINKRRNLEASSCRGKMNEILDMFDNVGGLVSEAMGKPEKSKEPGDSCSSFN